MTQAMPPKPAAPDGDWLALALDIGGIGAFDLNLASGALTSTAACKAIFGREPTLPFSRDDLLAALHADDRGAAARIFEAGLACDEEYRVVRAGGERRIELTGRVVLDAAGQGDLKLVKS